MLFLISLASFATILNLSIQLGIISGCLRLFIRRGKRYGLGVNQWRDLQTVAGMLFYILGGHLLQIAVWAGLFVWIDEFPSFKPAFYHSAVNFTTLGYGDIVMKNGWRLLGALEAAVGMMMFGVSVALLFSILSKLFQAKMRNNGLGVETEASKDRDTRS